LKRVFFGRALTLAIATLALTGSYSSASEVVYRWNDEAGNQVNSDRPPPQGIPYEVITTKSSMVSAVTAPGSTEPAEKKTQEGAESQPAAVGGIRKGVKNPEYCRQARDNLAALDSDVTIQMRNEKGEMYALSAAEREVQRKKAVDTIKISCDE
jgi:hypothetical protein